MKRESLDGIRISKDSPPPIGEAIKVFDARKVAVMGPNKMLGHRWPKGYSQTFKPKRGFKRDAAEVLGTEDLEYKAPNPNCQYIHLDRVGGFQGSTVVLALNPPAISVPIASAQPHLNRIRNGKRIPKGLADALGEKRSAVAPVGMIKDDRRLERKNGKRASL